MEVRLFGELEAVQAGVSVPVRGAKQRALLALLALQRGKPVSSDRLIDHLWGDGEVAKPAQRMSPLRLGGLAAANWIESGVENDSARRTKGSDAGTKERMRSRSSGFERRRSFG